MADWIGGKFRPERFQAQIRAIDLGRYREHKEEGVTQKQQTKNKEQKNKKQKNKKQKNKKQRTENKNIIIIPLASFIVFQRRN